MLDVVTPDGSKFAISIFAAKRAPKSERACKPWLVAGVSPRTYYRRKAAARAALPVQHSAHVVRWYEQAGGIARLEYRAMMRRCLATKAVS